MNKYRTKTTIALILMFAMTTSLVALPTAFAQDSWSIYIDGRTSDGRVRGEVRLDNARQLETFTGILLGVRVGAADWTYLGPFSTDNGRVDYYYDLTPDVTYTFQYIVPAQGELPVNNETADGRWYSDTIELTFTYNAATQAAIDAGMDWDINYDASSTRLEIWERWRDEMPTHMFAVVSPNPVGVGQMATILLLNPQVPPGSSASGAGAEVRWFYSVTIERPDGTVERHPAPGEVPGAYTPAIQDGLFASDSTGSTFMTFTPAETGDYTITAKFHELRYPWSASATMRNFYGVTLLESTYTVTLEVQDEPVEPVTWVPTPLPTEYWTRPIEGQNTAWYQVASNWLSGPHDRNLGGADNMFQPHGIAPESGHILWTRPTEDGGLVGGDLFSTEGEVFNAGHQYQTRFTNPIIMHGRLYYAESMYWGGTGPDYVCLDLRTGEEIWRLDRTEAGVGVPSFGYYYDYDDMNQHGIVNPGWLFTANFGAAIHPLHATVPGLSLENVPSGEQVIGPKGEHIRYNIYNAGSSAEPDWRLRQWNSTRCFTTSSTATVDASTANRFDWDVPIPWREGMSSVSLRGAIFDDVLIGSNGSHPVAPAYNYPEEVTFWGVSLKPEDQGRLMWMRNYVTCTPDNQNMIFRRAAEGAIIFSRTPYMSWVAYDMYTGNFLWETEPEADFNPFGYYGTASMYRVYEHSIAYGTLFAAGYSGRVTAFDLADGTLKWSYEAPTGQSVFPYYTLLIGAIADGKIYLGTHEHSAQTPLFKGNLVRCLDVETGEELWTHYGWANPQSMAVADGILIYWNNYDHQIYAVGKGPTSTTVTASPKISVHGSSVLVEGSVMDVSAGTMQHEQAMRFPNGVPAVSQESMKGWMEYVYMQKARPADAVGVDVIVYVLDPNDNYYEIGRTTSSASGTFKLMFEPEVPGEYTIIARFEGSEGYWPSDAETAIGVEEAPAPPPEPTPPASSVADVYFLPAVIGIIIAIVVIGAILILMLKKR
jgi:outer membrane protein assembly factor BamB